MSPWTWSSMSMTSVKVGMQTADNVTDGSEKLLRAQGEQGKLNTARDVKVACNCHFLRGVDRVACVWRTQVWTQTRRQKNSNKKRACICLRLRNRKPGENKTLSKTKLKPILVKNWNDYNLLWTWCSRTWKKLWNIYENQKHEHVLHHITKDPRWQEGWGNRRHDEERMETHRLNTQEVIMGSGNTKETADTNAHNDTLGRCKTKHTDRGKHRTFTK